MLPRQKQMAILVTKVHDTLLLHQVDRSIPHFLLVAKKDQADPLAHYPRPSVTSTAVSPLAGLTSLTAVNQSRVRRATHTSIFASGECHAKFAECVRVRLDLRLYSINAAL